CELNNGDCQQSCHNLEGSYICRCNRGYTLLPNGRDCTGKYHYPDRRKMFSINV
ncbi:predicted protein, partial [Nematostella vectensis]